MASTRGTGSSLPLWQRASPTAGGTWMRWTWLSLAGRPERSAALMASMQRRHESVSEPHVADPRPQPHAGPLWPQSPWGRPGRNPLTKGNTCKGQQLLFGALGPGGGGVAQRGWVMGQVFLSMYFTSIRVLLDISTYTWEHRTKSRGTAGGCQQEREHTHHRTPQAPGVEAANTTKHAGGHGPPPQLHPACAHSPAWTAAAEQHGDERRDT